MGNTNGIEEPVGLNLLNIRETFQDGIRKGDHPNYGYKT